MKKFVLIVLFFSVSALNTFADNRDGWGIGTALYGGYGYGPGILLKTPVLPLYWGINVSLRGIPDEQYFAVSISGDYHFIDKPFNNAGKFGWFLGGGIIFSHSHFDGKSALSARIPAGVYFAPIKHFDIVLEFAPGAGIYFGESNVKPDYGMSGSLGFRYWF